MNELQNSITVKRIRNNDNLSLSFKGNGKPLMQFWDTSDNVAHPNWEAAGIAESDKPSLEPQIFSASRNGYVEKILNRWKYNGISLDFSVPDGEGWNKTADGRFKMNLKSGKIIVLKNLASKDNVANDVLSYTGQVSINGVEANISKDVTVQIVSSGSNSYMVAIDATTQELTEDVVSTVIKVVVQHGSTLLGGDDYSVEWRNGDDVVAGNDTNQITIDRDDVDGAAVISAFIKIDGASGYVARASISIKDNKDPLKIVFTKNGAQDISDNANVTIGASVKKANNGADAGVAIKTYDWTVYREGDVNPVRENITTPTITLTTADTDKEETDGSYTYHDVLVVCEVTF